MNSLEAKCWMVSVFLARIFRVVLYYLVLHGNSLVEYVFYLDWESCHWGVPVSVSFLFTRGDEFDEEFPVVSASVAFYRQRQTLAILLQVDISNILQINLQENQVWQLVSIYITMNFSQNVVEKLQFWPISSLFEWSYLGAVHILFLHSWVFFSLQMFYSWIGPGTFPLTFQLFAAFSRAKVRKRSPTERSTDPLCRMVSYYLQTVPIPTFYDRRATVLQLNILQEGWLPHNGRPRVPSAAGRSCLDPWYTYECSPRSTPGGPWYIVL